MRALLALGAIFAGISLAEAPARALALAPASCTAGAPTLEGALAVAPADFDCGAGRFAKHDRFVRAHVSLASLEALPNTRLIWESEPASFNSMLIQLSYADGSRRIIDVDRQMTVRNWLANGNFWVRINPAASPLVAIDVVVERPHSTAVLSHMQLSEVADAVTANYYRTLGVVLLCGILLTTIGYNMLFYRVLREKFIIWHVGITAGTLIYALFNSGLAMLFWPSVGSLTRFSMIFIPGAMMLACATRFSIQMLEGQVDRRLTRLLDILCVLLLGLGVVLAFDVEVLRLRVVPAYFVILLAMLIAAATMLGSAARRGVRGAVPLIFGFAPAILVGLAQTTESLGVGFGGRSGIIDDLLNVGLVLMVVGTSAVVGERFLLLKGERDRARISAQRLGAMATSDELTGLLNRRAFDRHRRLAAGWVLLLADLDRFKAINDNFGHQRGDAVLRHAARVIETVASGLPGGAVYRMGGEEFAVLAALPGRADAEALCESLRVAVAATSKEAELDDLPPVTISIGGVLGRGQPMHAAYADADQALYRSKEAGRDRWEVVAA